MPQQCYHANDYNNLHIPDIYIVIHILLLIYKIPKLHTLKSLLVAIVISNSVYIQKKMSECHGK
jgi:hypothetical protein